MAIRGFAQRFLSSAAAVAVVLGVVHMELPEQTPSSESGSFVRGIFGVGASDQVRAAGFNTVNVVSPTRSSLDALASRGFKAVVWLGEYDRTNRCGFEFSDASVRSIVGGVAGHPAIAAYQLSDEPNYARLRCATAVQQHRDRAALIKSVDPSKPTYVTISTWDGREGYPYQYFAGVADIMGLDVYPCVISSSCSFGMINTAIAQAAQDGVSRYWAVVQDFADGYYRVPTASELRTQFERWAPSNLEGYFVYHWVYGNIGSRSDHLAVLADVVSLFDGGSTPPPSSPSPSPRPSTSSSPSPSPTPTQSRPPTAAGTTIARDSFVRDGAGWGTADVGGAWTVVSGWSGAFRCADSRGLINAAVQADSFAAILGSVSVRDVDAAVTITLPDIDGGGNLYSYLLLRRSGSSANIRVGLYVTPSGAVTIRGQDSTGSYLFPDVPTGLTVTGSEQLRLRVVVTGSTPTTVRARVWRAGGPEPSAWATSATTNRSGIQGAGAVGVRTINLSGSRETVSFDDLLVKSL